MRPATDHPSRAVLFAAGACILALVAFMLPADATAGRYIVAQCDRANREAADAIFERHQSGDYGFARRCDEDEDANSLQIRTITGAPPGHRGRITWLAPDGTRIVGLSLEARLRNDAGHQASVGFVNGNGAEIARIATGGDGPGGFEKYERRASGGGREGFAATLRCGGKRPCPSTGRARAWIRDVRMTLDDRVPPKLTLGGGLLGRGWHRGIAPLKAVAVDSGAGVRRVEVTAGGRNVAPPRTLGCSVVAGSALAKRTSPCPKTARTDLTVDTRKGPFKDGVNALSVCASDFGSGSTPACEKRFVSVDNEAPRLSFANAQDPADPELIRAYAADRHSGLRSGTISYRPLGGGAWRELDTRRVAGELRARVNSASEHKGRYEFRVAAADVAGNVGLSAKRRNGSPMVLSFPLRESTKVSASVDGRDRARIDYGQRPEVAGALRDSQGRPITGERVLVLERFDAGSSLEPIGRSARTDRKGRYSLKISRGPSRRVIVGYGGSRRYLPSEAERVRVTVRGKARMKVSSKRVRAGRKVTFRGRVGTYGAQMPHAGKLVELQVKGGGIGHYRTVKKAFRTDRGGGWALPYRFDRFYSRPTRFRFRLRVTPENRWPYLTPVHSDARRLTVRPR